MRGPPITIKCECGETRQVPYGERWQCETCSRRWNTAEIPAAEYDGIMREMKRFRFSEIGFAVAIGLTFVLLATLISESLFLMLPVVLAAWYLVYMPMWRAKVRRRARSLPTWLLHPE